MKSEVETNIFFFRTYMLLSAAVPPLCTLSLVPSSQKTPAHLASKLDIVHGCQSWMLYLYAIFAVIIW